MACTTILVGKNVSYDGSTMIARNDDSGSGHFTAKKFVVIHPEEQPKVYRSVLSHVEIKLPGDPMKFTAVPNAIRGKGIWAASGVNEKNVGMTATETITSNARVLGADPLVKFQPAEDGKEEAAGGIGEHLAYALQQNGWNGRFLHCAVRTACLPHATVPQIKQCTGLDAADIVQAVRAALTKGENEL